MIEPVDPDYTQGDGQFCPHSPLHSLHNNSLLSRREEGRKEEGEGRKLRWKKSNCWSKCEVKCSGSARREGAVSYFERCGFSVGSSFLSHFFLSIIDEKNLQLDQYYQISFSGALSLALKSIFFFSKSCHVWDYACDGLSHHPPLAHTLLPLRHRGWSKSYQSCLAFFYLFMYLTLSSRTPHSAVHRARRSMLDWRLGGMASAVFEGTSLVNMFVRDCWVNGIRRLIISQSGEEEEFFEIRTEWSDRNILYLHRSYSDLGRLFRRLVESFPEDRRDLSKSPLIEGWCDSG